MEVNASKIQMVQTKNRGASVKELSSIVNDLVSLVQINYLLHSVLFVIHLDDS